MSQWYQVPVLNFPNQIFSVLVRYWHLAFWVPVRHRFLPSNSSPCRYGTIPGIYRTMTHF
ncbi:hypothetical protein Hanom_Chr04g00336711 [Helianthus anomalus]